MEKTEQLKVPSSDLKEFISKVLERVGMNRADADLTADSLIFADLRGKGTHGISRLWTYIKMIEGKVINPIPEIKVLKFASGTTLIDGNNGMGQVVANYAMKLAIENAKKTGVSLVGSINGGHLGALAYWSMMALSHNMIGLCTSNGTAVMPVWGSKQANLCNMPISISVPTNGAFPLVLDMALSVAARGNIILAAKTGVKIPNNWAIDKDGSPTEDPEKALDGAVLPIGGYKGSGLAIMIEILTSVLLGGKLSKDCGFLAPADLVLSKPLGFNSLMAAINVENFLPIDIFLQRVTELIEILKYSGKAKAFTEIHMPGEQSFNVEEERKKNGIPLSEKTIGELVILAEKLHIEKTYFNR
jgi:LDH2 family malate/lactate/ureidoglycolate dehydrogenase